MSEYQEFRLAFWGMEKLCLQEIPGTDYGFDPIRCVWCRMQNVSRTGNVSGNNRDRLLATGNVYRAMEGLPLSP